MGAGFRLLSYGNDEGIRHDPECARTQFQAAVRAVALRSSPGDVVVWHLGMLKLLPLMGRRRRTIFQFLHGVECWRTLDPVTRRLAGSVDCFLTNSSFTWNRFIEHNPFLSGSRHRVVSLGLGEVEPSLPAPSPVPAALIMGRMQRGEGYKGHEELIRAWPLVRQHVPSAELWIAGGGSLEPELKQIANDVGQGGSIRFFGVISDQEKLRLLRDCRCLALPSKGEGFGLVYLEAMRLGRPCLTGTTDAGREVVNPPVAGLAADPGDAAPLSDALVRLLTAGPEWDRWSANAKALYESRFTAAHFEERLLQALSA
jgi:phosphatidylinositol alpha-1,6-mannosyltransferase